MRTPPRWLLFWSVLGALEAAAPHVRAAGDLSAMEEGAGDKDESEISTVEKAQRLADRVPSVTRRAFRKDQRFELYPGLGAGLNDPFYDHLIGSAGVAYHVFEWLSVGVSGDYFLSFPALIPLSGGGAIEKQAEVNRPAYGARLEVGFSPFYGKISVLAETVLHVDVFVTGGVGVLGTTKSGTTVAGVLGLGQHIFLNQWLAVRVELRDQIYRLSKEVADPNKNKSLQNLLTVTAGFCFFFPSDFEHEAM